jgi:alpha-tubulin suppressor-like RCC1 family protein
MKQLIRKTSRIGLSLFLLAGLLVGALSLNSTQTAQAATNVTATTVSVGFLHACALTSDGYVQCWGDNSYGELGNGTNTGSSTPVVVSGISAATAISSGTYHNCAVDAGAAKCWGWNSSGQLGDGTTTNRSTPVTVSGLSSGVSAVSAGGFFSCALMSTGTVKCWGTNVEGQLGNGTTTASLTPVDVTGLSGVVSIASGELHTCALTSGGAVLCWGYNFTGALGNGTNTDSYVPTGVSGLSSGVVAISAGERNNCALTTGGAVKCWGFGFFGELGNGSNTNSYVPVDVVGLSSGVSAIGAGTEHACAVVGGIAKCWGFNQSGQLGNGTNTDSNVPVNVSNLTNISQVGVGYSTCAVTSAGAVYCWGYNNSGQLGNGTTTDSNVPVSVTLISVQCPAGQYDNGTGCVDAPAGYYVPVPGATSAIPCPVGTFQPLSGATSCDPAPAGSFVAFEGQIEATACELGTYQPYSGQTSCFLADPGYFVDTVGAVAQTMCPVGYTSDIYGATSCYRINNAPTANAGGPYLVAVNASIAFDGSGSTDPEGDALTETWTAAGGTVSGNSFTAGSQAGIYDVCLTVNDGNLDSEPGCTIVVVYDPSAGFVTGGGWIDSPAGAYTADSSLSGKATFGFVAKYKKGANVPDGNTEFQFKTDVLNFKSSSYEWLVVAGNKAQFKGEGTINGQGSYKFMIWADDDNPDTFRIQIWGDSGTVYDNGSQQSLGGGSIVIHSK